jgi:hypothetical protein
MPQEVLDPLQVPVGLSGVRGEGRVIVLVPIGGLGRQGPGHLAQHGQPHGDVEPVQVVLGRTAPPAGTGRQQDQQAFPARHR